MSKKIKGSVSQLAEKLIYLDGKPLSYSDYEHQREVIDNSSKNVVMKFSRQTAKSTTLAVLVTMLSITRQSFKSMYVAPRIDQTKLFSRDRLEPMLLASPKIKKSFIDPAVPQNVFYKQLKNGSKIYLRYAYLSADSLRGYSTDMLLFDEVQDLIPEVIAIAGETMSRSLYKRQVFAGTPKRTQGTLSNYWFNSTRNEWAIKCEKCNNWNVPLNETNVADFGLCCSKCKSEIFPRNGTWVCTGDPNAPAVGFRVSALQFYQAPWVNWKKDIIDKRRLHGDAIWFNEVLGLEYDDGVSPLTLDEIRAACNSNQPLTYKLTKPEVRVMGLDYGPINSTNSYTYLAMGYWKSHDVFQFVYFKRYAGHEANPSYYHDDIAKIYNDSGSLLIGADYGMGEASNSEIRKRIGFSKLVAYFASDSQKEMTKMNPTMPGYTFSKSKVCTQFIQGIKDGKIRFPKWEGTDGLPGMAAHAQEFANVSIDYNEDKNRQTFSKIGTDDGFQAAINCWLVAHLAKNL